LEELMKRFDDVSDEFFNSRGYKELVELENLLKAATISNFWSFSSNVVRGLDYYTGTVFEVFDTNFDKIRAIFGGGRYDNLLSLFSDEDLSGLGFGMGVLMLTLFLETYTLIPDFVSEPEYSDIIYIDMIH
jgi:histidyl-tRNA synthetase